MQLSTLQYILKMQTTNSKQDHFGNAAVGLFLITIILGKYTEASGLLYRFNSGIAYPAMFVLMGLHFRTSKNIKTLLKTTIKELCFLVTISYISYLLTQLYSYASFHWGSTEYWKVYTDYMRQTLYYSAGREYGDIPSIGPVWMLISIYVTRLIINTISTIVYKISEARNKILGIKREYVIIIVCAGIGIIGSTLIFHYRILPLNLSVDFLTILLTSVGMAWRYLYRKRNLKLYKTIATMMAAAGTIALVENKLMNIIGLNFPGHYMAIVLSICCIIPICHAAEHINKISILNDFFSLSAKYAIVIIISSEFDTVYSSMWNIDNSIFSSIARTAMTYAVCGTAIQTWNVIVNDKTVTAINDAIRLKHHDMIKKLYYITIAILYAAATLPYGSIGNLISEKSSKSFENASVAILFIVFSYAITCYKSKNTAILMIMIAWMAFVQTILGNNQNSILGFTLLAGTSILSSRHIIAKIIMCVELVFIMTMYVLSMNGYIPYGTGSIAAGLTGHDFGTIGKNELAAFYLIIGITCCMAHKNRKWNVVILDTALIGLMAFINQRYVGGRSDYALTVLLLIGNIIYQFIYKLSIKYNIIANITKIYHYIIGIPIYFIVMFCYIVIVANYDGINIPFGNIISKFTDTTTYGNRLWLSKTAMMVYKPKFWGQYIFETLSNNEGAGYFWIDDSYIRMILMYGIASTISIIIILTLYQYINAKNKRYFLVFVGTIMALMGIMGHRLPIYLFNPIPAVLFADNNAAKKMQKEII